jgi:ABC-type transporter Mla subunit MlaD
MGKHPSLTIVIVAVAGAAIALALARPVTHPQVIKCYFKDAQGLRLQAKVRLAGVEVGTVTSVRVVPERHDYPAEVVMTLQTPYELKVPDDAVVTLESAGVLGETFPQINIGDATGPPLRSGGELKTRPSENPTTEQLLQCFSNIVDHKPCDLRHKGDNANESAAVSSTK